MIQIPYASSNSFFGLATETTYGIAASVSTFTPIGSPKVEPKLTWLNDGDFRGSPVANYDQVPGVRTDTFSGKVFMYNDVYPQLLRAALGSTDTTASVGPSKYTHVIGLNNSPNTGSQAPSYTIVNYSVDNTYQLTASRLVDLSLTFGADAAVETTFSFDGNIYTNPASVAPVESTQHLIPAWNTSASIGGASVAVIESGQLDIKRSTAPIFTIGQQGPYNNFQGPLEVSGSFAFVVENGETFNANSLVRDEQQLLLNFTDPVTGYSILFRMSDIQLQDPTIDQSKAYIALETKFMAVANTTDSVTTGYSPIWTQTTNGISLPY